MRVSHALASAVLALMTGACNMARSERPLFAAADAQGSARLKDGVWLVDDARCHFRESRPFKHWPTCANWAQVKPGELQVYNPGQTQSWRTDPFLLTGGDLAIAQVRSGDAYAYYGVRVARTNKAGEAVELRLWPVLCGAPHTGLPQNATVGMIVGTDEPFAGMTLDDARVDCFARDAASLRDAAAQSERWVAPIAVKWTRRFG